MMLRLAKDYSYKLQVLHPLLLIHCTSISSLHILQYISDTNWKKYELVVDSRFSHRIKRSQVGKRIRRLCMYERKRQSEYVFQKK